ncbi:MAG: DNA polymerase III subunit gamma/tau [Desulfovibrionaceae bacterium]|nr:DNA polymerase III subunit gamma/tau [Desulfovibrionaceae bacterium]
MKYISLASRYRPQTFADVAGQDMVKAVLSRAAQEDKVAPAYLFSGTRGVGKTTIARIFAKALNCAHAPAAEPCNDCEQCRKITQGVHVDVTEIDGASNNSVEDARALRETIGYAAMEGRYKVFIIDEAHMLSRSAFNALLKTLEEPPARVVFIFATTEAHKFPVTIVSRCQHFIFKHLPESALIAHLNKILQAEGMHFDAGAVALIARRAAGSVRDAMSLLDQCLALGGDALTQESARAVLGVAGQDLFIALLDALVAQDCAAIARLLRRLLDQGVDIGFFLRELGTLWRTLFLLRQSGESIVPVLDMPADECALWLAQAPRFSLQHIHAAWQMVLDAQRRITHSPEPAAALELLLLHLALLPRLLPLEQLPSFAQGHAAPNSAASPAAPAASVPPAAVPSTAAPSVPYGADSAAPVASVIPTASAASAPAASFAPAPTLAQSTAYMPAASAAPTAQSAPIGSAMRVAQPAPATKPTSAEHNKPAPASPRQEPQAQGQGLPAAPAQPALAQAAEARAQEQYAPEKTTQTQATSQPSSAQAAPEQTRAAQSAPKPLAPVQAAPPAAEQKTAGEGLSWEHFCEFCASVQEQGGTSLPLRMMRSVSGHFSAQGCRIQTPSQQQCDSLERSRPVLENLLAQYCHQAIGLLIVPPARAPRTEAQLKDEFSQRAEVKLCCELLDARLDRVHPLSKNP